MDNGTMGDEVDTLVADFQILMIEGWKLGIVVTIAKCEVVTDDKEVLQKIWVLRKVLHPMDELASIEFLLGKMQETKTNVQFFDAMKR